MAGYGDQHYKVEKQIYTPTESDESEERTATHVRALAGDERIEELAQMLGVVSESTRESAREILDQVREVKATRFPENG